MMNAEFGIHHSRFVIHHSLCQSARAVAGGAAGHNRRMYRRDYILRLIERFGRMLIAIRNIILRRQSDPAQVQAQIGDIADQAGLDLSIARRLDPTTLLLWLAPTGDFDVPRLWLMAELLYLHGLEANALPDGDARGDFQRALALFTHLAPEWRPMDDLASAGERVVEIRRWLDDDVREAQL